MRHHGWVGAVLVLAWLPGTGHAGDVKTVNVNCGTGQTIGGTLANHSAPGRTLIVTISGACNENVVVTADDTTLRGDPAGGASVNGPDPNQNTILVNGAARSVIENLIVTGARSGIVATNSASLSVVNVRAQSNAQSGSARSPAADSTSTAVSRATTVATGSSSSTTRRGSSRTPRFSKTARAG
jgi:hypothetical protein